MASDKKHIIYKGIEEGLRVTPYVHEDANAAWHEFSTKAGIYEISEAPVYRISWRQSTAVAATMLTILCIFIFISRPVRFTKTLVTKENEARILLFDESEILAAKNTILHYPVRQKDIVVRRVVLEKGMASFEVKKADLPFIVSADNVDIRVTGTIFSVEKRSGEVFVKVKEGTVLVLKDKDETRQISLQADETLLACRGEFFVSANGGPFEQKTMFTYSSKIKEQERLTREKQSVHNSAGDNQGGESGSNYRMVDVIKFLDKKYKKELKFKKKRKLKSKNVVKLDLQLPLSDLLKEMKRKNLIDYEPGKCEGCYIISPLGLEDK